LQVALEVILGHYPAGILGSYPRRYPWKLSWEVVLQASLAVILAGILGIEGGKTGISDVLRPLVKVSLHGEATSMFDVDLRG